LKYVEGKETQYASINIPFSILLLRSWSVGWSVTWLVGWLFVCFFCWSVGFWFVCFLFFCCFVVSL